MSDILLRGALDALKNKAQALAASETATAEDLAMLGTALERIGGRASIIEIEMSAENQKGTIASVATAERNAALAAITQAVTDATAAVDALLASINTRVADADTATSGYVTTAQAAVGNAESAAVAAIGAAETTAISNVNAAALAAVNTASGTTAEGFFYAQL